VRRRALLAAPALLLAAPSRAMEVEGTVMPGALLIGRAAPLTRVAFNGRPLRVSREGVCAFGLGRDAVNVAVLDIKPPIGPPETRRLTVLPRTYDEQRIDGLPQAQVTPPPETLDRIRADQARLNAARAHDTEGARFADGFIWPAEGRISGVFGSRRVLNGVPRAPHLGLDIAAPTGTPVVASAAGIVRLAEDDLYYTGGSLLVDHGHTVMTFYIHLSRLLVQAGQTVAQGETIGLIGATGRVTGPHLHLGLFWAGTALDPALVLPPRPGVPRAG
jgi:murein DD-endopeptidase MepM/ murein hydrolase activator NlpD